MTSILPAAEVGGYGCVRGAESKVRWGDLEDDNPSHLCPWLGRRILSTQAVPLKVFDDDDEVIFHMPDVTLGMIKCPRFSPE